MTSHDGDHETPKQVKTKTLSARLLPEFYERFQAIKHTQTHPRVPDSDLVIEALRLYVLLAEEFGIDRDTYMIKKSIGRYHPLPARDLHRKSKKGDHLAS